MSSYKTEQEHFWAGEFGDAYTKRNQGEPVVVSNIALFAKIFARTHNVNSLIEFGANRGLNLSAINRLLPGVEMSAIEINATAIEELSRLGEVKVYPLSILDFVPDYQRDLALIKGVLIHIDPDQLGVVYDLLYKSSRRYICLVEYYNPTPMEIPYRGHQGMLFKRDFAGEMLDRFPDLRLADYGFVYHRDPNFPQDDATWFLLEKRTA
jgi:spore coat polysaccharide biosynthesis protein SpsF